MHRVRSDVPAGTALAMMLTVLSTAVVAAPSASPATLSSDSLQLRGTLPASDETPSQPAASEHLETKAPDAAQAAPAETGPGAATAPAAATDPIAVALRELIGSKRFEQLIARKSDRDAIATLYQKTRDFRPLWVDAEGPTGRAKIAIDYLRTVDAEGLDPRDYPAPNFAGGAPAQAETDIRTTAVLLRYARHAMTGRVHYSRVSRNVEYKSAFDAEGALNTIASSDDLATTLQRFNPQHPAYQALKGKLAELRAAAADAGPRFANGPVLRFVRERGTRDIMMTDPRVPTLRARLGLAAEPNLNYDHALADAVAKFQDAHGLQPTGQLNGATIDALNGPNRGKRMDAILATLERWRWLPRELGRSHVMLNIPDYHLRVYHDGAKVWQTRVVVGKPTQQTPILTEIMKTITVNPTWNVPQSIIYNELLPVYEGGDPQIFERQGLRVERGRDGGIRVYQPPGEHNALGRIRFNFPNKFLVYQHDTPEKHYFALGRRALSHGCMRVEDPVKYAEVLLSYAAPKLAMTQARIKQMFGGEEQQLELATPIPVHLTYQTAFVDEQGALQIRDDIYGHDTRLLSLLRGSERVVADVAIEQPADLNFKRSAGAMHRLNDVARGGGRSSFSPFERLFP